MVDSTSTSETMFSPAETNAPYATRAAANYKQMVPRSDFAAMAVSMWLIQARGAHRSALAKFHSAFGYTKSNERYTLLRILYFSQPGTLTLNEIGNDMMMSSANLTYLIDQLEKEQLVVRKADSVDRRVTHLELTPSGNEICKNLIPAMADFMAEMLQGFSEDEKKQFYSFLERFYRNAEAYHGPMQAS